MRTTRLLVAAAVCLTTLAACKQNLAWKEPKVYAPPAAETLAVNGLGINDTVLVFPPNSPALTISHDVQNTEQQATGANWVATDSIRGWVLVGSVTSTFQWQPGPPATHTAGVLNAPGIALAGGASGTLTFPPFAVPNTCGLYGETLRLDTGNQMRETNEADNLDPKPHLFFVPSAQRIVITLDTLKNQLFHNAGDVATYTFNVVSTLNGAPAPAVLTDFTFATNEGSTAYLVPGPKIPTNPAGRITATMHVVTKQHTSNSGTIIGKISVMAADGCVFRQKSARVFVEHTI